MVGKNASNVTGTQSKKTKTNPAVKQKYRLKCGEYMKKTKTDVEEQKKIGNHIYVYDIPFMTSLAY